VDTLIGTTALVGYEELATSLGLDVARQLRRVGLSAASLHDPEGQVPLEAIVELLERSAADASCRSLGLRLSLRHGIDIVGPMVVASDHTETLQDAVDFASRYLVVHSPALRLHCDTVPGRCDLVDLCLAIEPGGTGSATQAVELALGVMVGCLRLLGQGQIDPVLILLPHARLASRRAYADVLGAACSFGHSRAAVRLRAGDLLRALPHDSPTMRMFVQTCIDTYGAASGQAISGRVRRLVGQLLGTGRASQEVVSRILCVHPRTLQRRLGEEGTTFEKIKDDVRRTLFRTQIECPHAPVLAALTAKLDYADASALTRSCHRWFGASPSALRRQAAQAPSDL